MVSDDSQTLAESFADGAVTLEITPITSGTARFTLEHKGRKLVNDEYSRVFESGDYPRQQRARVRNDCIDALDSVDGMDADEIGAEIETWLNTLKERAKEAESELAGPLAKEIMEGTQTPVEIYEAPDENTTWHVTLSFRGRTRELEFDASAMVGDSSGELANKLVHNYNEVVEPTAEDWERIRDYWVQHKTVVDKTTESEQDAIVDRFLSLLADAIQPSTDRDKFVSSVSAAWVDAENSMAVDGADAVVYISDDLLVDEIERMGKSLDYKGQLLKDLRKCDALLAKKKPQSWTEGTDTLKVWAFEPAALGVDPEQELAISDVATSEVSP